MDKKLEVKNLQISFRTQGGNVKAVRNIWIMQGRKSYVDIEQDKVVHLLIMYQLM